MNYKLLWSATAAVLDVLTNDTRSSRTHTVVINDSIVDNNNYTYNVSLDNKNYLFKYVFDNNNYITGKLYIDQGDHISEYNIRRHDKVIRISHGDEKYIELHLYIDRTAVAVYIADRKKIQISSLQIFVHPKEDLHHIVIDVHIDSAIPESIDIDDTRLHLCLFAISGALHHDVTEVPDVATITTERMQMVVFSGETENLISINTYPPYVDESCYMVDEHVGTVTVINSDFHQHYEYTYDIMSNTYEITEYVTNMFGIKSVKTSYLYHEVDGLISIINLDKQYLIERTKNGIKFTQQ